MELKEEHQQQQETNIQEKTGKDTIATKYWKQASLGLSRLEKSFQANSGEAEDFSDFDHESF